MTFILLPFPFTMKTVQEQRIKEEKQRKCEATLVDIILENKRDKTQQFFIHPLTMAKEKRVYVCKKL
ncbi:CLUMA_CG012322, isoform A [Clunio marinus]|uniref:CLUMA_CG012322, isoform A n=1 Tax=Clunio marinus TaxID=568069 RepID=A0A1J1IGU1_9DIPT|nr:CLUMA_CG012322, isoform A [Clunio marinus]